MTTKPTRRTASRADGDTVALPAFESFGWWTKHQFVVTLDRALRNDTIEWSENAPFIRILQTAIDTCGLDQNDLAELFKTSHTSISRWINNKSLPHPAYREALVRKLMEYVDNLSREEKSQNVGRGG